MSDHGAQIDEAAAGDASAAVPAGLAEFQNRRKKDTRSRLLRAAATEFCERGYAPVSVEDIASGAGVSRMTFYRHFGGKAEIASELFRANSRAHMPMIAAIGQKDFQDRSTVREWIASIFAIDREQRAILQAFMQANVIESGFAQEGHAFIDAIIEELGKTIPAFALDARAQSDRRRYVEASLLLYEILDQSNHAARSLSLAADFLIVDILTDHFINFVGKRAHAPSN
ncbi:TetR/AcrR family transcriptional regulator [Novosphingobium malaysiense]|uniref:TetR/AcrR family transcriptional regulator n=1 Tax=Novosphingobium malaysiense TaxID=1348853 RepID=UPI00068DC4F0|nr:TetR/AcrR family transcriptional regulator [Novosphingobium malaysiense]